MLCGLIASVLKTVLLYILSVIFVGGVHLVSVNYFILVESRSHLLGFYIMVPSITW